jgi:cytoskeletal protein RodZ
MSDQDRGAYTPPTEPPLAFDARQPVRGGRPAPLTLIISTVVLVALGVAIVMFYQSGVRQAGEAPRAIGEPVGELKSAAPADAQPVDPAAGLEIYKSEGEGETAVPAQPQFSPPPETPQPRQPVVAVPPPQAAPTTPVTSGPTAAGLKPAQPAPVTPAPKAATPAPIPAAKTPTTPTPALKTTPAPAPKAAAPPAPVGTGGGASVQIGAFSSQALADSNWASAVKLPGGAGKGKRVEQVPKNGATLFRTTVTGFASRSDAVAFCEALQASGKSCFVR